MLINNYSIKKYDDTLKFVLTTSQGHFYINESTKKLITILDGKKSTEEALKDFNETFNGNLSKDDFIAFLDNRLKGLGLLKDDTHIIKSNAFVKAKLTLLPPKVASILAAPFSYFFRATYFWYLLAILFTVCTTIVVNHIEIYNLNSPFDHVKELLLLALPVVFFHELGHVAACKPAGVKNGEIGLGLYLIFPVFYSDISNLWTATKKQRIIANLAGVFNQWLYAIILYGFFITLGSKVFLTISILIMIDGVYQLYPFVRSDGYWILSDLLSIPNLQSKGRANLANLLKGKWTHLKVKSKTEIFILCYSIVNLCFIVFYIYFLIVENWHSFIHFPENFITQVYYLFTFKWNEISISPMFILHSIVYLTIGKFILRKIKSKFYNNRKKIHT